MKIKFDSDDGLPLNKTIEIPTMTIIVRAVFHENDKYSQQAFLDECLQKKNGKVKMNLGKLILNIVHVINLL